VPAEQRVEFADVLRLSSVADKTAKVEFAISGLPDGAAQVGLWDEKRGLVTNGLTLRAGELAHVAFALTLPAATSSALLEGSVTVIATVDGASQRVEVPLLVTVTPAEAEPAGSPSPEPDSSPATSPSLPTLRILADGPRWLPLALRFGVLL
jgi:hypothetical protein